MPILDEKSKTPLYIQLYQQIREDIVNGNIKAGAKLNSSRKASADMGVSRNTVALAYDRLYSEGFIISKPRKGYYIASLDIETLHKSETLKDTQALSDERLHQKVVYDFRPYGLHLKKIPFVQWQRLMNKCFHYYREENFQYGSAFGETELRTFIQRYIYSCRNVNCTAQQIVIGTGTQFCLNLVCQLIKSGALSVAMEEPGCDQSRMTFQNNCLEIHPVELDEHGLDVKKLYATDAMAAYVTPSHQFPTGIVMPVTRRLELVEWAKRKNAFIIEDDYNCHFQHNMKPIPSIQSLCGDRVIYLGDFTNMLFPCISISYMVIPEHLLAVLHKRFDNGAPFAPFLMQKALELFIREGYWESHLRKTKKRQKEKSEALVAALKSEFGKSICIFGVNTGLHLLVRVKWSMNETELIQRAFLKGVGVYPTSGYWIRAGNDEKGTVLLNFEGIELKDIPAAVRLLRKAWLET